MTPVKADALAEQVRKKSARATAQRIAGTITLERFLIERYEDHLKAHGKTGTRQAQMIRSGFAHLLNRDLSEIHPWDIEKWRSERLKAGSSPSTCNRLIKALRGALSRAIEWKLLEAAVNPLKPCDAALFVLPGGLVAGRITDNAEAKKAHATSTGTTGTTSRRPGVYR